MNNKKQTDTIHVTVEQHFFEYEGHIYTDIAFAYSYWQEYLTVFDRVCPIGRVKKLRTLPDGWPRVDGPSVCFVPNPMKKLLEKNLQLMDIAEQKQININP